MYPHNTIGFSWPKIAALDEYKGILLGTLCSIIKWWQPKDPEYRARLELPVVIVMGEPRECAWEGCEREFVSNHPSRKYYPICSPSRTDR